MHLIFLFVVLYAILLAGSVYRLKLRLLFLVSVVILLLSPPLV
jgi:hypothetical protein